MFGYVPCSLAVVLDDTGQVLPRWAAVEKNEGNASLLALLRELRGQGRGHQKQGIDTVLQQILDVGIRVRRTLDGKDQYVFASPRQALQQRIQHRQEKGVSRVAAVDDTDDSRLPLDQRAGEEVGAVTQ